MNAAEALAKLRKAGVSAIETGEASALLGQSVSAAHKTLARLASAGLILRLRSGTWWLAAAASPLLVAPWIAAPYSAYVSLASALRYHGMVEQIPSVTYVVTLGRSRRVRTSLGTFSLHHLRPELFGGFEDRDGIGIALPEKALFDLAYVAGGRGQLRAGVPELELPKRFRTAELERWVRRIPSQRGRTLTQKRIDAMLKSVRG